MGHITGNKNKPVRRLLVLTALLLITCIAAEAYFFVLPDRFAKQYLTNVQPVYWAQAIQLQAVFKSYDQKTPMGQSDLQKVIKANDKLGDQNNLTTLPGTEARKNVHSTLTKYDAMQQYVNDSRSLLTTYQDDLDYISQLNRLRQSPALSDFYNKLDQIGRAGTADQLYNQTGQAATDLQTLAANVRKLHPTSDFQDTNDKLFATVNGVSNAFIDIMANIKGEVAPQVAATVHNLQQTAAPMQGFPLARSADMFNPGTALSQEVQRLRPQQPFSS